MTTKDGATTPLVPGAHRTVRVLAASEGPFRGTLVSAGDGVAVLADAVELSGWSGWRYAGAEHVAGPVDLVRRADGQDVLLPWCTETVEAFLGRRTAIDAPLTSGEVSTLVVSALRGVGEVHDAAADTGTWWLTDGGRPLFVIGDGRDVRAGAAAIITLMRREGGDRALGRLLDTIHDGLIDGMARPQMPGALLERWEADLFEIAAPRALDTALHAPERVREIEALRDGAAGRVPVSRRAVRRAALGGVPAGSGRDAVSAKLTGVVEAARGALRALAERVARSRSEPSRARTRASRPHPGPSRGKKLAIAGAAAMVVVVGGARWPGGATGEATPAPSRPATQTPTVSSANPSAEEPVGQVDPGTPAPADSADDPVAAATGLLEVITACAEQVDTACQDAVAAGSVGVVDAVGTRPDGQAAPAVSLVDSYGDIAVVRVITEAEGSSAELMVVLVRINEKWLVRDVYDVADQPG